MTAVAQKDLAAQVGAFVEEQLAYFGVPGLALAIIRDGETILQGGFGLRSIADQLPVTEETVFAIGSVSKSFTSALIASLVDEGLVEWGKPVREYLPAFRMHDPAATENMTVRDLLCHRSGLPRHDLLWYGNYSLTRAELVGRLQHLKPNAGFREVWQYNNLMYITAGHLAEVVLGKTWEEAVRERLLEPLEMSATGFSVEEARTAPDHATAYQALKGDLVEMEWRGLDLAGPAGSINSSIADLARWATVHASAGQFQGRQVISADALKELHRPTMVLPEGPAMWPEIMPTAYGLGWFMESYRGHKIVHHGGNIDGFSSMVSLLPEANLGVAVLTNLNISPLRDVLPYHVYDLVLGLDPINWAERYKGLYDAMIGGAIEAVGHRRGSAKTAPSSHPLEDYVGRYNHPGYGDLLVSVEDGALAIHYNELETITTHLHYDVWEVAVKGSEEFGTLLFSFAGDVEGDVASVSAQLEASVEAIVFTRQADDSLASEDQLRAFEGAYQLGPMTLNIKLDRGKLHAQMPGQPPAELEPYRPSFFRVKKQPAITLEFLLADDGSVEKVVVQPAGIFARIDGAENGKSALPAR